MSLSIENAKLLTVKYLEKMLPGFAEASAETREQMYRAWSRGQEALARAERTTEEFEAAGRRLASLSAGHSIELSVAGNRYMLKRVS